MAELRHGVSILIATRGGVDRISHVLRSLNSQTLDHNQFEIICCLNGPDDGTRSLVEAFSANHPSLNIVILKTGEVRLAGARNAGLTAASFQFFTIIDDDDWVSPSYLEKLLAHASMTTMPSTFICNISDGGGQGESFNNRYTRGLIAHAGQTKEVYGLPVCSADVAKIAPTIYGREVLYDEELLSGLDVVFWSELVLRFSMKAHVLKVSDHAFYYRRVRGGSVSRSYDSQFIEDRFTVISRLSDMAEKYPHADSMIRRWIRGQVGHLGRVVYDRPDMHEQMLNRLREQQGVSNAHGISEFNHFAAKKLATCYVYTPFNTTSAVVAAKRLVTAGESFDVITQDMAPLRTIDASTQDIDAPLLGKRVTLPGRPGKSSLKLASFCRDGSRAWETLSRGRPPYENLYSRAQWPHSHALAALIKVRQPNINWEAEFSDPISVGTKGIPHQVTLDNSPERDEIDLALHQAGFPTDPDITLDAWIEHITYALADKILFINDNQRQFMVSRITDEALAARVMEHSVISPHPVVPDHVMKLVSETPKPADGKIHIGYFGMYYERRGIGEILAALSRLSPALQRQVIFHVYAPAIQLRTVRKHVRKFHLGRVVRVNRYLNYVDFLGAARAMDWVLIVDTQVNDIFGINPYLPSKYADFLSTGTKMWGILEQGSPLSSRPLDAVSATGDIDRAVELLEQIIESAHTETG